MTTFVAYLSRHCLECYKRPQSHSTQASMMTKTRLGSAYIQAKLTDCHRWTVSIKHISTWSSIPLHLTVYRVVQKTSRTFARVIWPNGQSESTQKLFYSVTRHEAIFASSSSFALLLVRRLCQNVTVDWIISNWSAESAESVLYSPLPLMLDVFPHCSTAFLILAVWCRRLDIYLW